MTDLLKDATPEVRAAAKDLLPTAVKVLHDYLMSGDVSFATPSTDPLDDAIARATALDDRLAYKVGEKEAARALLSEAFQKALAIATKLAIAAV